MKTKSTKATKRPASKRVSRKTSSAFNTCPVGGAGWCAYPFSVAQLEKRMKAISEHAESEKELVGSGSARSKSR